MLGYAAKYAGRYGVKLYALAIEGNHIQGPAHFPQANRFQFMRDLNSSIARAVPHCTPSYPGGRFWGRRYSNEFLIGDDDIEEYFFYTVLQPVQDGLVERLSDYPFYNCFSDAIRGIARKQKVVRWGEYHAAKRFNPSVSKHAFTDTFDLAFERLPGYEHLGQHEYCKLMHQKLEQRRLAIVRKRQAQGKSFFGRAALLKIATGSRPIRSKRSTITSHRPRVLSVCPVRRRQGKAWYFSIYFQYRQASSEYRAGNIDTPFPHGTHPPPLPALALEAA